MCNFNRVKFIRVQRKSVVEVKLTLTVYSVPSLLSHLRSLFFRGSLAEKVNLTCQGRVGRRQELVV